MQQQQEEEEVRKFITTAAANNNDDNNPFIVNVGEVLDCVAESVQCLIHCILYYRGVYPASSFEKRQLHGLVVPCHRHPKVVEYVCKAVEQMRRLLSENMKVDVRIPIMDEDDNEDVREMYRFIFSPDEGKGEGWYRMYDEIRAVLLRLQAVSCSEMMEDPSGRRVSFRIQICARGARDLLDGWMVVGRENDGSSSRPQGGRVIPLPSVHIASSSSSSSSYGGHGTTADDAGGGGLMMTSMDGHVVVV